MPDTGAPWNIPYVAGTDLVSDWPTDSLAVANAVDAGLDTLLAGGIGSNVVQTVKTDTFSTTSTGQTGVTGLSAAITPSSATSKVLVIAQVTVGASDIVAVTLSGGNAGNYIGDTASNRTRVIGAIQGTSAGSGFNPANNLFLQTAVYLDSPATTSPVTYQVEIGTRGVGTAYVNRSSTDTDLSTFHRGASSITLIEVAA